MLRRSKINLSKSNLLYKFDWAAFCKNLKNIHIPTLEEFDKSLGFSAKGLFNCFKDAAYLQSQGWSPTPHHKSALDDFWDADSEWRKALKFAENRIPFIQNHSLRCAIQEISSGIFQLTRAILEDKNEIATNLNISPYKQYFLIFLS